MDIFKENDGNLTGTDIIESRIEKPIFTLLIPCDMPLSQIPQSKGPWIRNRILPTHNKV